MKIRFHKALSLLMGIYFLNLSVDVVAPLDGTPDKDIAVNKQESVLEVVLECCLGLGDVVEETQDESNNEHRHWSSKKVDVLLHCNPIKISIGNLEVVLVEQGFENAGKCRSGYGRIYSPPPEVFQS
jgi:hypothetical protein